MRFTPFISCFYLQKIVMATQLLSGYRGVSLAYYENSGTIIERCPLSSNLSSFFFDLHSHPRWHYCPVAVVQSLLPSPPAPTPLKKPIRQRQRRDGGLGEGCKGWRREGSEDRKGHCRHRRDKTGRHTGRQGGGVRHTDTKHNISRVIKKLSSAL